VGSRVGQVGDLAAIMGLLPKTARVNGSVRLRGTELLKADD